MPSLISQGCRNFLPAQATEGRSRVRASCHDTSLAPGTLTGGQMLVTLSMLPDLEKQSNFCSPQAFGEGSNTIPEEFTLIIYVFAFKGMFTNTKLSWFSNKIHSQQRHNSIWRRSHHRCPWLSEQHPAFSCVSESLFSYSPPWLGFNDPSGWTWYKAWSGKNDANNYKKWFS